MNLRRGVQICATHHIGDVLRIIIYDHGKMIGCPLILSAQYHVSNLRNKRLCFERDPLRMLLAKFFIGHGFL